MFSLALFHKLTDISSVWLSMHCLSRLDEKRNLHLIMFLICIFQTMSVLNGSDQILKVLYCESLNIIYLTTLIPPS